MDTSLVCKKIRGRLRVYVHITVEGKAISKRRKDKPTNKRLNRILPGALMAANGKLNVMVASRGLHNGIPDNYVFDNNSKAKPSKCTLINKNKGIVFVSNSVS